jgi:hypothetical protein
MHRSRIRIAGAALAFVLLAAWARAQDSRPAEALNEAQAIARRIEKEVAEVRGLPYLSPTKIGVYTRDQLALLLRAEADTELPPETAGRITRALRLFGLVPEGFDLRTTMLAVLESQIGGFYDPKKKELFLIKVAADDAKGKKLNETIMSHELVHALQDQHFDLEKLMKLKDDSDRVAALKSVIEGDATYAMMVFSLQAMKGSPPSAQEMAPVAAMMPTTLAGMRKLVEGMKKTPAQSQPVSAGDAPASAPADADGPPGLDGFDMEALYEAPAVIADELVFAYMGGMRFCQALIAQSERPSMGAIDAAFRRPPRSTEQILHPEKYARKPDWPTDVVLPDLGRTLGDGYVLEMSDNLGELHVRTLLAAHEIARPASIHGGWDGDRYALYAKGGAPDVLLWLSTWDTPKDAEDMARALVEILVRLTPDADDVTIDGCLTVRAKGSSSNAVVLDGQNVILVRQVPHTALKTAIERLRRDTRLVPVDGPAAPEKSGK